MIRYGAVRALVGCCVDLGVVNIGKPPADDVRRARLYCLPAFVDIVLVASWPRSKREGAETAHTKSSISIDCANLRNKPFDNARIWQDERKRSNTLRTYIVYIPYEIRCMVSCANASRLCDTCEHCGLFSSGARGGS